MTTPKKFVYLLLSLSLIVLFLAGESALAASPTPSPFGSQPGRVRILDYENGSAAGLLLLEIDRAMGNLLPVKPAWDSLDRISAGSPEQLAVSVASGTYDLVITGDEAFVKNLGDRGALQDRIPLFGSELILVGPKGEEKRYEGKKTAEIMKELFVAKKIFFTPMDDAWTGEQEAKLWREAGVSSPGTNVNYVESGRDDLSLLLQVEEEGGYTLTTAGAFAQYLTSTRAPESLVKMAGTGAFHTHYLCLVDHQGFREERTKNAEKLAEWLVGEKASKTINGFTLAEIRPFATK